MDSPDAQAFAFLRSAPDAASLGHLTDRFADALAPFGYPFFACVRYGSPGQPVSPRLLFGRASPDWYARYTSEQLFFDDPTIGTVFARARPFSWSDVSAEPLAPRRRRVFEDAARAGLHGGFIVPVTGPYGDVVSILMTSDSATESDARARAVLTALATVYATIGNSFLEASHDEPTASPLTRRECECLSWAAQGKTDWEIGRVVGIAPRTVGLHLDNARAKIGAATRAQAVIEAWRHGMLLGWGERADYGKSRIH